MLCVTPCAPTGRHPNIVLFHGACPAPRGAPAVALAAPSWPRAPKNHTPGPRGHWRGGLSVGPALPSKGPPNHMFGSFWGHFHAKDDFWWSEQAVGDGPWMGLYPGLGEVSIPPPVTCPSFLKRSRARRCGSGSSTARGSLGGLENRRDRGLRWRQKVDEVI